MPADDKSAGDQRTCPRRRMPTAEVRPYRARPGLGAGGAEVTPFLGAGAGILGVDMPIDRVNLAGNVIGPFGETSSPYEPSPGRSHRPWLPQGRHGELRAGKVLGAHLGAADGDHRFRLWCSRSSAGAATEQLRSDRCCCVGVEEMLLSRCSPPAVDAAVRARGVSIALGTAPRGSRRSDGNSPLGLAHDRQAVLQVAELSFTPWSRSRRWRSRS